MVSHPSTVRAGSAKVELQLRERASEFRQAGSQPIPVAGLAPCMAASMGGCDWAVRRADGSRGTQRSAHLEAVAAPGPRAKASAGIRPRAAGMQQRRALQRP